ncbi:metal-dependent phosphohydrolase [Streptomyces sp. NBC_00237]|uniref:HD-GYP domain-containing protein n=1 Tax=Streptomyces sp. NBC_00237 TaxID=2975687 RepID=UPI002255BE23|nr:metal-dependent phosphohydrolase [Streptomyces sp. NBC_00237]MCX5204328.1 metal-dependent phosphohydrolase [Streptomyces sp. NBC_00237]
MSGAGGEDRAGKEVQAWWRRRWAVAAPPFVVVVRGAALLWLLVALLCVVRDGIAQPGTALAFGLLICLGELAHRGGEAAPLGTAGALAYALLGHSGGAPTTHGVLQVVVVCASASALGTAGGGARPGLDRIARRVLVVGFAAVCFQPAYNSGVVDGWVGHGTLYALFLALLLALTGLSEAVLAAALLRARTGHPYGPLLRDELRGLRGIGSAVCATGVVMALAVGVVGLWALPVFCVPLLLTQLSLRRYAEVRDTYRQTIASLARATEIAGYTRPGHAHRVAALSVAVGREMGLSGDELTLLEYAALMHDIGQLSLVDPVPAGATASLPVADQRRIALLGGAVVRQTGVPADVAVVVERQADPYREQPLTARIVRAVNAYDDLAGECGGGLGGPLSALELLRSGTGHDYQSEVVESLALVLRRGSPRRGSLRRGRPARGVGLPPPG